MTLNVYIDPRAILQAMRKKGKNGWTKRDTCANCHVDWRTLNTILAGRVPKVLPAFYRVLNGLGLQESEVLIATPPAEARRSEIRFLNRRENRE